MEGVPWAQRLRPRLFGRERELESLNTMLDAAAAGRGSVLIVRGEAGIGKTALLASLSREAEGRGFTVLTAAGVESEAAVPFAALHQLLGPLLHGVGTLPAPHQEALRAVLGPGVAPTDLYGIAVAVLHLVTDAALSKPVALVVDDVHWLDPASADVLAFLSRRLGGEAVLCVGGTRTVSLDDPLRRAGLSDTYLTRLSDTDARALLEARAPQLPPAVRTRVLEQAAGNPLALVELPLALGHHGAGSAFEEAGLPLNERLEAAFAARFGDLAVPARTLLVVLAAGADGDLGRLIAAAAHAAGDPVTVADTQSAIDVGLVELEATRLRFRHPLMGSAVYGQASLHERLAAHSALAHQLAAFPERRLWHLAAAALGADEALADDLEAYADRALDRGATLSGVAALCRAVELTEVRERGMSLLLRALEAASELGVRHVVERLLRHEYLADPGPVERGRLANILEAVRFSRFPDPEQRVRELVGLAAAVRTTGHRDLAVTLLWRAAVRCFVHDVGAEPRRAVAGTLDRLDLPAHDPRALAVLAYTVPEERGEHVVAHLERAPVDGTGTEDLRFLGSAAVGMGDFRRGRAFLDAAVAELRAGGRTGELPWLLDAASRGDIWAGRWDGARTRSEESRRLAADTGEEGAALMARTNSAVVSALRGDLAEASEAVDAVAAHPLADGMRHVHIAVTQVRGLVLLLNHQADDAYRTLAGVFDPTGPARHRFLCWSVVPELVDAAVAAGRADHARSLLGRLPRLAARVQSDALVVAAHYSRAVLAADEDADAAFEEALAADLGDRPFHRARLQLHLGRRKRRQRRLTESRPLLRAAYATFDALGARPWSEMALVELRAAGEPGPRRDTPGRDRLSAQELQIAGLAAQGLTNRQIAEKLYLSPRTVGSHLYRIYPRLGIGSRAELAAALEAEVQAEHAHAGDGHPTPAKPPGPPAPLTARVRAPAGPGRTAAVPVRVLKPPLGRGDE